MAKLTQDDIQRLRNALKPDMKALEKRFEGTVLTFKDEILTEVKNLRDDVAITTGYRDQIEDHEVRLETLENKVGIK